ncbi:MAG: GNAT family protein [bacterium]
MMNTLFKLTTQRLLCRCLEQRDQEAFFVYRKLPSVGEFQFYRPNSLADVERFFRQLAAQPAVANSWFQIGLHLQQDDQLIGDIGMHFLENANQVEIGYTIAPAFQRQGYATEALTAVIAYLFGNLSVHRIIASIDPRNAASVALLTKMHFRFEAHFVKSVQIDGEWLDDCIYALLRDEWLSELPRAVSEKR